jgi:hypothetical protein
MGTTPTALSSRAQRGRAPRHERWRALRALAVDVPLMVVAPLVRRWHLRWGATDAEVAASMPGDELLPAAQYRSTRAITIDAPPAAVWPWLVQVGSARAGWYSDDLLDNLGHPSARRLVPELQQLELGQWVPMSPFGTPSEVTAFRVATFEACRSLLWVKPDSTWSWTLMEPTPGRTRLVTRIHAARDWRHHPGLALLGVLLMEVGDFAMLRRMLLGIAERAERVDG